jgi:hypothetical protein
MGTDATWLFLLRGGGVEETHKEWREVPYHRYLYNDGNGCNLVIFIARWRGVEETHEEGREPYPRYLYSDGNGCNVVIFIARGMEETHEEGREGGAVPSLFI